MFATARDGTRVAYDISGSGPALILLHGGWRTRRDWHDAGYVARLQENFTVVTIDIRGNGDSDRPASPSAYTIANMCGDILTVADTCGLESFTLWGFSYGGNIGRFLAARSDRVTKLIIMGIPFGFAASDEFRAFIEDYRAHWTPILQAQRWGTLEIESLSKDDQLDLQEADIPTSVAWLSAMLDWGAVEPADLRCPTLWLIGSENEFALANAEEYKDTLSATSVQLKIIDGLDHSGEFAEIDRVLPIMRDFTTL